MGVRIGDNLVSVSAPQLPRLCNENSPTSSTLRKVVVRGLDEAEDTRARSLPGQDGEKQPDLSQRFSGSGYWRTSFHVRGVGLSSVSARGSSLSPPPQWTPARDT